MYWTDELGRIYDGDGVIAQDGNPKHLAFIAWMEDGNTPLHEEDKNAPQ